MNTTENNKIIAEFMEHKPTFEVYVNDKLTTLQNPIKEYHKDWNWLMEVVEKIEGILPNNEVVAINYKDCIILTDNEGLHISENAGTKIQAVYNACLEFINWHNVQEISAKKI